MPGKPKRPGGHGYGRRSKSALDDGLRREQSLHALLKTPQHKKRYATYLATVCCCAILSCNVRMPLQVCMLLYLLQCYQRGGLLINLMMKSSVYNYGNNSLVLQLLFSMFC